jgi:hypothetical protein
VLPPLVGVALKVTDVPAHIVFPGLALMLMAGATADETDIVSVFEVAEDGDAHAAFDVITQLTVLPFAREALE